MVSQDTLRTVIEIVPDSCEIDGDEYIIWTQYGRLNVAPDEPMFLDHLAAAAVRVVDKLCNDRNKGFYSNNRGCELYWPGVGHNECGYLIWKGSDRTTITLEAIAEFVKGGGFDG